jgi:hypothetical protein
LTGRPDRVISPYKTTAGGPVDPSGLPTVTWRDPSGANNPEVELVGIQYVGDNDNHYFPLRVTAALANDPMFRHTGLQEMPGNLRRHRPTAAETGADRSQPVPSDMVIL